MKIEDLKNMDATIDTVRKYLESEFMQNNVMAVVRNENFLTSHTIQIDLSDEFIPNDISDIIKRHIACTVKDMDDKYDYNILPPTINIKDKSMEIEFQTGIFYGGNKEAPCTYCGESLLSVEQWQSILTPAINHHSL